jgi:hypothetical protein
MKKEEVELIIVGVNLGNQQALNMKIYKDGTLCRSGCGGLPTFPISGMTVEGKKEYWERIITMIDEQIIQNPINYEEKNIIEPLEYFIAFFGASDNGQTGEQANWTKTSGVRFLLDNNTKFQHPLLGFLDNFVIKAADITNEWFFDIVMTAVYDVKPVNLENTFVTVPKTEKEKQEALSAYVNQIMANNPRGWDIVKIGNGRKYKKQEIELTASVENKRGNISINFHEVFDKNNLEKAKERLSNILSDENNNPRMKNESAKKMLDEAEYRIKDRYVKPENSPTKKWWEFWK